MIKPTLLVLLSLDFLISCKTLEEASMHGLTSGYYALGVEKKKDQDVYADVSNDQIDVYPLKDGQLNKSNPLNIPLLYTESLMVQEIVLKKQSLDIDLTSILLKYRPTVHGSTPQLTSELNIALYAGWRHDQHRISTVKDPLGKYHPKIRNLGYDFGFFAGPGTTMITPFTTNGKRADEYSGMIIQAGVAGFLESNVASFGLSIGFDHLLNADRNIWIYQQKPWVGFIVGIALN